MVVFANQSVLRQKWFHTNEVLYETLLQWEYIVFHWCPNMISYFTRIILWLITWYFLLTPPFVGLKLFEFWLFTLLDFPDFPIRGVVSELSSGNTSWDSENTRKCYEWIIQKNLCMFLKLPNIISKRLCSCACDVKVEKPLSKNIAEVVEVKKTEKNRIFQ